MPVDPAIADAVSRGNPVVRDAHRTSIPESRQLLSSLTLSGALCSHTVPRRHVIAFASRDAMFGGSS